MTKPTKTTGRSKSPDTSTINSSEAGSGSLKNTGSPEIFAQGTHRPVDTSTPHTTGSEVVGDPRVVVSYLTDPVLAKANARLAEISLPVLQTHLLTPHKSVDGLFVAPGGQTYAHLEDGHHYRVELNTAGDYQIPWPAAPGVTPPILKKVDGQSRWRVEAQWYKAQSRQRNLSAQQRTAEQVQEIILVDPHLATLLPAAQESLDGIRKGPRGKTYVDIADGTILVRRNEQGEYKLASATTINVPDITFEQIPGQFVWRRKSKTNTDPHQAPQPGSSRALTQSEKPGPSPRKRPRLPEDSDPLNPFVLMGISELWKGWGTTKIPSAGDSIEISGKHFAILDQPTYAVDGFAFIKPPQFSATRFDAFEQLLLTHSELQPRGVVKLADNTGHGSEAWRIVESRPFEKSLTQYVSDQFPYLSDHSASKAAREMFNRASHSDKITGPGISALFETFKYWENRSVLMGDNKVVRQDLSDPLMLLSPLAVDVHGYMRMPLPSTEGLQRIDFNPKLLSGSQHQRGGRTTRTLFKDLLSAHGYFIAHDFGASLGNALLIKRTGVDPVFIMFMDRIQNNTVFLPDPVAWLNKRVLVDNMDTHVKDDLMEHLHTNRVIFLLGTNEPLPTHEHNLIVTRHS
ncbi:hypothetical protein [Pseudomonas fluorescens]|uniref:Uncharacterized protein n=1 Tax=Pseudomonas fluorescens TaxID=294 RepID=A0A5E6QKX5_PSEFL|nr:hypothetical protein [Pseudomonas fluorescens]VVM56363.1 hypothetical protein PS655_01049 [Pseudomonas fluorescens]